MTVGHLLNLAVIVKAFLGEFMGDIGRKSDR